MKILIFGLPGSGKTTFAKKLIESWQYQDRVLLKPRDALTSGEYYHMSWLNADEVRKQFNDWDFSSEGRLRQSKRMCDLANTAVRWGHIAVADFVCPTKETRDSFDADISVFMDTITEGRFDDTNQMFDRNCDPTYTVTNWEQEGEIIEQILKELVSY